MAALNLVCTTAIARYFQRERLPEEKESREEAANKHTILYLHVAAAAVSRLGIPDPLPFQKREFLAALTRAKHPLLNAIPFSGKQLDDIEIIFRYKMQMLLSKGYQHRIPRAKQYNLQGKVVTTPRQFELVEVMPNQNRLTPFIILNHKTKLEKQQGAIDCCIGLGSVRKWTYAISNMGEIVARAVFLQENNQHDIGYLQQFNNKMGIHPLIGGFTYKARKTKIPKFVIYQPYAQDLSKVSINFSPIQRIEMSLSLLTGLTTIHASNVIHGDLKPENILIAEQDFDRYGRARICDFSHSHNKDVIFTTINLTPEYYPPEFYDMAERINEQRHGVLIADIPSFRKEFSSDIWCMGIILMAIIKGKMPDICSIDTLLGRQAHLADKRASNCTSFFPEEPKEDQGMDYVIWRMLKITPAARPTADQARAWIEAVLKRHSG